MTDTTSDPTPTATAHVHGLVIAADQLAELARGATRPGTRPRDIIGRTLGELCTVVADLAGAVLRAGQGAPPPGPCPSMTPDFLPGGPPVTCALRAGHAGDHDQALAAPPWHADVVQRLRADLDEARHDWGAAREDAGELRSELSALRDGLDEVLPSVAGWSDADRLVALGGRIGDAYRTKRYLDEVTNELAAETESYAHFRDRLIVALRQQDGASDDTLVSAAERAAQAPGASCGVRVQLEGLGTYPCVIPHDADGGHSGDCVTQPERDGLWPRQAPGGPPHDHGSTSEVVGHRYAVRWETSDGDVTIEHPPPTELAKDDGEQWARTMVARYPAVPDATASLYRGEIGLWVVVPADTGAASGDGAAP